VSKFKMAVAGKQAIAMGNTTTRVARVAMTATILSMSTYPSLLAAAEAFGLNGLDVGTGRIAGASVDGTGTAIVPLVAHTQRHESSVKPAAAVALAPPPAGFIPAKVLDAEISTRFEALEQCRIDVARRKRVQMSSIEADRVTLRWTILRTGQAVATEAVATTPIDADVLDCVKREMNAWMFSRPSGGPLPIERFFRFRSVR
jgi:hypothetical protein